ncbi:hypothetical protein H0H81_000478 [Sphagnurus paluster]|uniref:Uncharacterized protein n=1 Tax=Sphagnurus paluster TaxID=117069 RepID=A0A9P7K369_9AGAR|nr:hypothetical protein H0H81_000478 [Sphagnurus paluster]
MGNGKRKAPSPAESTHPAPSHPVSPVYQAPSRRDTPDLGHINLQHAMEHHGYDSSSELEYQEEEQPNPNPTPLQIAKDCVSAFYLNLRNNNTAFKLATSFLIEDILEKTMRLQPDYLEKLLKRNPVAQDLIANAVSTALASATPPPPPPSPSTPTGPKSSGAMPPTRGNPTPPAAPAPCSSHAPAKPNPGPRAPKPAPPPLPAGSQADLRRSPQVQGTSPPQGPPAHQTGGPRHNQRPSPHHIVNTINHELQACADEVIHGVHIANLGDSHILAATWTVGCNLLITATKVHDYCGLDTPAYSTIVANALATIPGFSNQGATVIPYRPAARLQIKGLPTWDPTTNRPVELTSVYQTLDGLSIFEGVELIKNGPAPSDALSWARDPKTFNAKSCPCAVTVRFYNNDGRETGALLKKAFYLLGRRRRFDKWQPRPPPPKKG